MVFNLRSFLFRPLLGIFFLGLELSSLYAQQDRLASQINNGQTAVLAGRVHPLATPQNDQGRVADAFPVPGMMLRLKASATQQAALQQLLADQQNPASPLYHQWITPEEY